MADHLPQAAAWFMESLQRVPVAYRDGGDPEAYERAAEEMRAHLGASRAAKQTLDAIGPVRRDRDPTNVEALVEVLREELEHARRPAG